MESNYSLHTDAERRWYFLIPDGETLPEGDFEIFTLLGHPSRVNPDVLVQYEITRDDAQEWIKLQMMGWLHRAGEAFKKVVEEAHTKGHPDAPKTPPTFKPRWGIEVIADLMGESIAKLQNDPDARRRGWERLFYDAAVIFQAAKSGNPDELTLARAHLREIIRILREHGVPVSDSLEEFPQQLHDLYRAAQQ